MSSFVDLQIDPQIFNNNNENMSKKNLSIEIIKQNKHNLVFFNS